MNICEMGQEHVTETLGLMLCAAHCSTLAALPQGALGMPGAPHTDTHCWTKFHSRLENVHAPVIGCWPACLAAACSPPRWR